MDKPESSNSARRDGEKRLPGTQHNRKSVQWEPVPGKDGKRAVRIRQPDGCLDTFEDSDEDLLYRDALEEDTLREFKAEQELFQEEVLKELERQGAASVLTMLRGAIETPSGDLKSLARSLKAIELLGPIANLSPELIPQAASILRSLLRDSSRDYEVRRVALASILGFNKRYAASADVIEWVGDRATFVSRPKSARIAMIAGREDLVASDTMSQAAYGALRAIFVKDPQFVSELIALASDPSQPGYLRHMAIIGMSVLEGTPYLGQLTSIALNDKEPWLREEAYRTLLQTRNPAALRSCVDGLVQETSVSVRTAIIGNLPQAVEYDSRVGQLLAQQFRLDMPDSREKDSGKFTLETTALVSATLASAGVYYGRTGDSNLYAWISSVVGEVAKTEWVGGSPIVSFARIVAETRCKALGEMLREVLPLLSEQDRKTVSSLIDGV